MKHEIKTYLQDIKKLIDSAQKLNKNSEKKR